MYRKEQQEILGRTHGPYFAASDLIDILRQAEVVIEGQKAIDFWQENKRFGRHKKGRSVFSVSFL